MTPLEKQFDAYLTTNDKETIELE